MRHRSKLSRIFSASLAHQEVTLRFLSKIPRYIRIVDPYSAGSAFKLLEELDDTFSSEQLDLSSKWERMRQQQVEAAAQRRAANAHERGAKKT